MKIKTIIAYIFGHIKSLFISGLLTILPLTITIGIFSFSFNLIKDWLQPIYSLEPSWLRQIPHSEIIVAILAVLLLGAILKFLLLHSVVSIFESLLSKIPLLRQVYFGTKELINAFTPADKDSFKKVVLVEFPRSGIYSVGFLTSQMPEEISPPTGKVYYSIFIPATPNPTSGYFIAAEEKDFVIVDLTRQEAMTLIISGGIIKPDRLLRK